MTNITKHVFLESRKCLTRAWYLHNLGSSVPRSDAEQFRLEQGQEIGRLARLLYPGGILVDERRPSDAAKRTAALLADPKIDAIFEATFLAGGCTAKADILARGTEGWIVKEVKSALKGTKQISDLIDDVAYTTMVAQSAGLKAEQCCLLLVSSKYRKGMSPQDLFTEESVTHDVDARLAGFPAHVDRVVTCLDIAQPPQARLIAACRHCEFFATECIGHNLQSPITEIPRLHRNRLAQLVEANVVNISSVPDDFPFSDAQRIVVECAKVGRDHVGPTLWDDLTTVKWPVVYLDFETVATAIPLYPNVTPYEQVTTQFSVYICDSPGHVIDHREYLADPARDCRRELTDKLLAVLPGTGSIVVYHAAFERDRLTDLTELFQDLTPQLLNVINRLFDLEVMIRRGYYHPEFRGSYSIKRVLPVLVPALSYKGLPIGDGGMAVAKFARMAMGQYDAEEVAEIRQQLLDYCELDTLAMVRLHERLLKIAASTS